MATTRITNDALDQVARLPRPIQNRVVKIIERLNKWPQVSGAKPLRGELARKFRMRTGDYRVQFYLDDNGDPTIEKVGHRDGFYDE